MRWSIASLLPNAATCFHVMLQEECALEGQSMVVLTHAMLCYFLHVLPIIRVREKAG